MPLKLVFLTSRQNEYTIIFKNGDDIRQDHLVLKVITLINDVYFWDWLYSFRVDASEGKFGFEINSI